MHNQFQNAQEDEEVDIKMTELSEQSFYELFRLFVCDQKYIVKVFPSNRIIQYQKERQILEALNHPNIIKPLNSQSQLVGRLMITLKHQLIVFPEAPHGNLMKYIECFGSFSQQITRFYLKKIVRALIYTLDVAQNGHPNLTMDNILMKEDRDIVICGWSNSLQSNQRQLPFTIAQLAIQLLTGRNPFPNKDLKSSQFAKFLNTNNIHKFWQQMEKSARNRDKKFAFSQRFKHFVGLILLNKLNTLQEIDQLFLSQSLINLEDVKAQLQKRERIIENNRATKVMRL